MQLTRQRRWIIPTSIAAIAVVVCAVLLSHGAQDQPRAREYTSTRACLLTDANGVATEPAASVWQGMQDASAATHAQVSFQQASGSTSAEALPYLNGMVEQGCSVVLAVGDVPAAAAQASASTYSGVQFVIVGAATERDRENVERVALGTDLQDRVSKALKKLMPS